MVALVKDTIDDLVRSTTFKDPGVTEEGVIYLMANGDLRDSANKVCWAEQEKMERELIDIIQSMEYAPGKRYRVERLHDYDPDLGHGFINSQKMGNKIIRKIPKKAKVIVAEATWEYSHHIVGGLTEKIKNDQIELLTVANYSGTWPGLVGQSNLNASLVKRGLRLGEGFSTTWSESFSDQLFQERIGDWLQFGHIDLDRSHILEYDDKFIGAEVSDYGISMEIGGRMARKLKHERAIMLGLDFYCMGMDNAAFDPNDLSPMGIGHEYASQSELVATMGCIKDPLGIKAKLLEQKSKITDEEGWAVIQWCIDKGMTFHYRDLEKEGFYKRLEEAQGDVAKGKIIDEIVAIEKEHLTKRQLTEQGKGYIGTVRMSDKYGADVVGIQYQQGLKDCISCSDLIEGLLNDPDRPDVLGASGKVIRKGEAIPCFNEVDQGCGVDLVMSKRIWKAFDEDATANQEDVRWSRKYTGKATYKGKSIKLDQEEVWVDLLSGSAPAGHLKNGYRGADGFRQPWMYFPLGGSTLAGEGKSGEIVISRVYKNEEGEMCMNLMRGGVVELPDKERQNRLDLTTKQWPIKSVVRYGVNRDQMLLHPSNHETILYASSAEMANRMMVAKAQMARELGMKVEIWGDYSLEKSLEYRAKRKAA